MIRLEATSSDTRWSHSRRSYRKQRWGSLIDDDSDSDHDVDIDDDNDDNDDDDGTIK